MVVALCLAAWGVPRDERDVRCRYVVRGLDGDLVWWMPRSFDDSRTEMRALAAVSSIFLGALVERRNREQIKAVGESEHVMKFMLSAVNSEFMARCPVTRTALETSSALPCTWQQMGGVATGCSGTSSRGPYYPSWFPRGLKKLMKLREAEHDVKKCSMTAR